MTITHSVDSEGSHIFFSSTAGTYLVANENGVHVTSTLTTPAKGSATAISAVLGTIQLKLNRYILIANKHEVTGTILGNPIARVTSSSVVALGRENASKKDAEEQQYLALLSAHLNSATLFFSVDNKYDVTNSLQRQLASGGLAPPSPDTRFFWNRFVSEDLYSAGAEAFVTPVVYGYFKSHTAVFNNDTKLEFALLTRRAVARAGTRYFRRGVDADGNVANFNETEQIVTTHGNHVFAFLQTRGSVPVYWSEINNLRYRPNLALSSRPSQDATAKHFAQQVELYGDNYLVNLVNQSGYEQPVKEAYETAVAGLPEPLAQHVKYIYFDFHHECRKMRWDRVKLLIDRLVAEGCSADDFFGYDLSNGTVLSTQRNVVRTNCMDCLDRTNVVQSMLGRWVLQRQLEIGGYLAAANNQPWEAVDPAFNWFFMGFWADNADGVSKAYSGTGALKTDYTRTGKRTKLGALADLNNSITRYYLNNLRDGYRQDAYDLFLGNFQPSRDAIGGNPFVDRRAPYTQMLPYVVGALFFVLVVLLMYPSGLLLSWKNLLVVGGCVYFFLRSGSRLVKNGVQFVNWPALVPLDYLKQADEYSGGKRVGIRYDTSEDYHFSKKIN